MMPCSSATSCLLRIRPITTATPSLLLTTTTSHSYIQSRRYRIEKKEGDKAHVTIFDLLGIKGGDLTSLQRSPEVLRAYFKRAAAKLDPTTSGRDKAQMEKLVEAYKIIKNSKINLQYLDHDEPSIDMRIGVLNEGARVHGTNDPHHMNNLEQLLSQNASAALGDASESIPSLTGSSLSSSYAEKSFNDFTSAAGAFSDGTLGDVGSSNTAGRAGMSGLGDTSHQPLPKPGEVLTPLNGTPVSFLLKLSFDEAVYGCMKAVRYKRLQKCAGCWGSGRNGTRHTRCPQCVGRGSTRLPSGTYVSEQMCGYCNGHGKVPPGLCSLCRGTCVSLADEVYTVVIPSASKTATVLHIQGKGNDGRRGGKAGPLAITLLVSEHKLFHAVGADLHCIVPVVLSTALLGGFIKVKTLKGYEQLQLPPGVQSGDVFTMEGHGIQDRNGTSMEGDAKRQALGKDAPEVVSGNMKVHVIVVVPDGSRLTGRQHRALLAFHNDRPLVATPRDTTITDATDDTVDINPPVPSSSTGPSKSKKKNGWRQISDPIASPSSQDTVVDTYPEEVYEQLKVQYSSWLSEGARPKLTKGGY